MMPTSDADAFRFLTQSSFGPTPDDVARVKAIGYDNWIDEQFGMQLQTTHVQMVAATAVARSAPSPNPYDVNYSWWTHALKDPAQLRQRVAFALSEIFVVSTMTVDNGRTVASYLDMLTDMSNARFRDLLESVAMHPAMGQYLSHLANQKEDAVSGRTPDENFAREIMQLFSIGLYELDDSGTPKLVEGKPVETYNADDIKGMAKVFTGFSWNWPSAKSALQWWQCFWRNTNCSDASQDVTRMSAYAQAHSTSTKQFLGITVPAQSTADPQASLKAALDRLASHPNTAPFISKQLIQRLVTSNPSKAYVTDITRVFRATDGDLGAVVKAILLHDEARHPPDELIPTYGKLREPILRMTHLMRAIPHTSTTYANQVANGQVPFYRMDDTNDPTSGLGQTPMRAPSVFNFFRPGYSPPQTNLGNAGLVAPEMQITNETSVLAYANAVARYMDEGAGEWLSGNGFDIKFDLSKWNSLADSPTDLVNAVAQSLLGKALPADVFNEAVATIAALPASPERQRRVRIQAAVLLVAVSPNFIIQQ
ncbi:MAG: DUF1800 domain-containing protein [Aquabacterium sp.]|nr:DUF1800 domain-containing protein [Aquabacterium sp.]